jgi:hypothetical protein
VTDHSIEQQIDAETRALVRALFGSTDDNQQTTTDTTQENQ